MPAVGSLRQGINERLGKCQARNGQCSIMRSALRHSGGLRRLEAPMDPQTVIATCEILLVVIGIIGLMLVGRE